MIMRCDFRSEELNYHLSTEQEHKVGDDPYQCEQGDDVIRRHVIVSIGHTPKHVHHSTHHEILEAEDKLVSESSLRWRVVNCMM